MAKYKIFVDGSSGTTGLRILCYSGRGGEFLQRDGNWRALSREDADELLGVIEVLCGLAARLAAQRLDHGAQRRRFEAAARALVEPRGEAELARLPDARAAYYRVMFEVAGNPELDRALPQPRARAAENRRAPTGYARP